MQKVDAVYAMGYSSTCCLVSGKKRTKILRIKISVRGLAIGTGGFLMKKK